MATFCSAFASQIKLWEVEGNQTLDTDTGNILNYQNIKSQIKDMTYDIVW